MEGMGVIIPNAFSPNGDGINDFFMVGGSGFDLIALKIYNRYGELMYETNNLADMGWDGFYKNTPQELGVYTYYLEYFSLLDNELEIRNGSVTLIK